MSAIHRSSARLGLTAIACAAIAACSSLDGASNRIASIVTPYKVEIVQGNFVSKEQVEALQRGMTRSQVKEVLGTPLMASVFHGNRWDYVFTLKRQGVPPQQRKLALFFQGDQLDKWEGDEMPTEAEFVAQLDSGRKQVKVPLLEVPEEVLKEFNAKNPPAPRAESAAAAAAPRASYPPLEAPGTVTQAWDASTQRAVVAAAAARPSAPPSAAPLAAAAPAVTVAGTSAGSSAGSSAGASQGAQAAAASSAPGATAARPAGSPAPGVAAVAATVPAPVQAPVSALPQAPAATAAPSGAVAPVVVGAAPAASPAAAPTVGQTAAAPVAAAAAPAPAVTSGFADMEADLAAFLNGWMNDWQARNPQAYFARYTPEFKGTSATRAEWEALRRPRIEVRSGMTLGVQDVRAVMVPPDGARIVFRQVYNSDAGSEVGTKALFLIKRDGRWLIEREFFTPAR